MAVIGFAAGYAGEIIGMTQEGIIGLFAVLQVAGVVGAYSFGFIQDPGGTEDAAGVGIGAVDRGVRVGGEM